MKEYQITELDCRMRYLDLPGEAVPILFLHGLGCAGSFDYPQVAAQPELAGHRRILVDLLGAGYSDKPTGFDYQVSSHAAYLKTFVDHLGLEAFVLFGHSLGGPVSIELARLCGSRVCALILSESNLDPCRRGAASYQIAQISGKAFLAQGYADLIAQSKAGGNTMWAASLSNCSPLAVHRLSECALRGGDPSWRAMLYELPVRKGFIFGEQSLPDPDAAELRRHQISVEIVPAAGHSMAWENPRGLAAAISRCLERGPVPGNTAV